MKIKSIAAILLALLLTALSFAACTPVDSEGGTTGNGNSDTTPPATKGEMKIKFLKVGKSPCVIIRTENSTVVIDAASDDKSGDITTYLAEKGITEIDYLILTNFSKTCIGGVSGIVKTSGITVKKIYEPSYAKESSAYTTYKNAVSGAGITPEKISGTSSITVDDVLITMYAPAKDYTTSSDENDEGNSVAVAVTHGDVSFLYTSRVNGDRVGELTSQLSGKTFNLITAPNYGIYDAPYDSFFKALDADYAVIFASTTNPPEAATETALKNAETAIFVTRDGGVEASSDGTTLTVKQ